MTRRFRGHRFWRASNGQTFTEYVMVVGLLTAIIIALTRVIVPGVAWVVVQLVQRMQVYITGYPG